MRVLLLSNMYPSADAPACGVFVKNAVSILEQHGIAVPYKITLSRMSRNVCAKGAQYVCFLTRAVACVLSSDYDVLYGHFVSHVALPVLVARIFTRRRIVLHVHGSDVLPTKLVGKLLQPLTSLALRAAHCTVVPSSFMRAHLLEHRGCRPDRVVVFPSGGVDQRVFHPRDDRAQLRAKYRVPEDAFVIGYVSRVERLKGWRVFVAALELMGRDVPGRVGLLVGEGRESAELRAVAARNGDWLRYLGQRSQPQLSEVYGLMDAFVFPTLLRESLGLVALEAMSCGVPVIGSRIGALPEYIKDGWNGFLVEPGDARGIADAATRIFNGLIDRSIIARYAEATARAYGVDRVAETLLAAIGNRLETV